MSNIEIKDIRSKIGSIFLAIEEYIKSTDHWLYYWINEPKIKEFIQDDPNEYETSILDLSVTSVGAVSANVEIRFLNQDNEEDVLDHFCILEKFRDTVNTNYLRNTKSIDEYRLGVLNKTLARYRKKTYEVENQIKDLMQKIGAGS